MARLSLPAARPRRDDLAAMLRLSVPVVLVQLGMVSLGTVDTLVVGRFSGAALAAVALGNLYFFATSAFAMGTLLALDPLVAQAAGAGDHVAAAKAVQRGLVLAVLLSLPTALAQLPGEVALTLLRQPGEIIPTAASYARICSLSVAPFLVFVVLRQALQAYKRLRDVVLVILAANALNLVLDVWLVFGGLGLRPMGPLGSAWASLACRWLMALGLLLLARRPLARLLGGPSRDVLNGVALRRMLVIGAPIGAQYLLEFATFGVIGLMMGWLGTAAIAAHQVAINLASLTFMVPLGVSAAAAVLVGHAVGAADEDAARRAAGAALLCGVSFMALMALAFLLLPGPLARAYTAAPAVLTIATALIPIAGFFQVFDGLQVVSIGILRGIGDTRTPMIVNVAGFWLVGMPVSVLLAFRFHLGPAGLWWGFVAGLGSVALLLLARVVVRMGGRLERLAVE